MAEISDSSFKKQVRILLAIVFIVAAILGIRLLTAQKHKTGSSGTREVMGTFARLVSVAPTNSINDASIEAGFSELVRIDAMMSDYKPQSPLSKVNANAFKEPIGVSDELMEILLTAKKYSAISDGAFDVTIGPVVDLWRNAKKKNAVPTKEQLAEAKAKVGYKKLILSDNTVLFAVEGMRLDLGAIAKGYAIDKAVEAMKRAGATSGFVDVGGDIRTFGSPPTKKHWIIGLQNPTTDAGILLTLKMNDMAVATSGDYRRYDEVKGKKHSHIKDPTTSQSVTRLTSVSVIAPTATIADILATTVSVIGQEKGMAMIEAMENTDLIMIPVDKQQDLIHTKTVKKYVDNTQPPAGYTTVSQLLKQKNTE